MHIFFLNDPKFKPVAIYVFFAEVHMHVYDKINTHI